MPSNKKKLKAWATTWNQMEKREVTQSKLPSILQVRPWENQCSVQELLDWRDHLFKDCYTGNEEEGQEEELGLFSAMKRSQLCAGTSSEVSKTFLGT